MNWLTESTVAYLNIDVGVSGKTPRLAATPELNTVATDIMRKILWPGNFSETMYDAWFAEYEGEVSVLGSGSDYTSFLHKGISSLDVGSDQGPDDPIYHYHRYVYLPDIDRMVLFHMAATRRSLIRYVATLCTSIRKERILIDFTAATTILTIGCLRTATRAIITTQQWDNS